MGTQLLGVPGEIPKVRRFNRGAVVAPLLYEVPTRSSLGDWDLHQVGRVCLARESEKKSHYSSWLLPSTKRSFDALGLKAYCSSNNPVDGIEAARARAASGRHNISSFTGTL
jgi:hypothetical protein